MKFTLAALGLVAVAQVAYACENKQCAEDDQECINACVDQINKCVSDCGGGNSCYQQCISEWTPTITNSAGAPVSTSDPLGSATADISGWSTVTGVSAGPATATATADGTMSMNTAPGASSGAPLTGSAAASFASASASLATAFSSATMSLQSGFSASLSAASSSVAGAASSAASSGSTSAAVESASSSAKIIYTVCAVAALALAL
ncbi:hypothetical protein INT43_009157 [Umbelopsis isabellina]|uniref:Uncharacterized protein n=1 Tax=Mortierella isabellina TaxID=91625 RepID=A0A8H7PDQ9_MORIS|nr:hypothetical protein INT43_009157 [Umbelopsis isabellina]